MYSSSVCGRETEYSARCERRVVAGRKSRWYTTSPEQLCSPNPPVFLAFRS